MKFLIYIALLLVVIVAFILGQRNLVSNVTESEKTKVSIPQAVFVKADHQQQKEIICNPTDKPNYLRNGKFNIGFFGYAGEGVSTVINNLRGLSPRHKGAAAVGSNDVTKKTTGYKFNEEIMLWDHIAIRNLTDKDPLQHYDAIFLLDQLGGEKLIRFHNYIKKCGIKKIYFINTKIDSIIKHADYGENEEETLKKQTGYFIQNLEIDEDKLFFADRDITGKHLYKLREFIEKLPNKN